MRLNKERNNKSADDYITSMAKSAGPEELKMMRTQATDQMKMIYFYRYWCLKEAVLKVSICHVGCIAIIEYKFIYNFPEVHNTIWGCIGLLKSMKKPL